MNKYKTLELSDVITKRHERISFLCWKVFNQSEDGKELMELWKEEYLMRPVADEKFRRVYGEHYVGIREGQNEFIREQYNLGINFKKLNEENEK